MIISAVYTLVFAFFIMIDLIPLYKNRKWKSFWTYTALLSVSYVFNLLIVIDVKLPSPAIPIKKMLSTLFGLS